MALLSPQLRRLRGLRLKLQKLIKTRTVQIMPLGRHSPAPKRNQNGSTRPLTALRQALSLLQRYVR